MDLFCWRLNLERHTLLVAYDDLDAELVSPRQLGRLTFGA